MAFNLVESANMFFGNDDELDAEVQALVEQEIIEEASTKNIKVEHPGMEKMKEGAWKEKNVGQLVSHFITLAKSKGKAPVMRSILNIERWNEKKEPSLSKKARSVINKLEKNKTWENM